MISSFSASLARSIFWQTHLEQLREREQVRQLKRAGVALMGLRTKELAKA
jgi:hypothetical protein